jgi:drug/metabolite transporter (DMT)-like permease
MNPRLGITLKIASVLLFVVMFTCVKAASAEVPPGEVVFFRSFFALVPILAYFGLRGELKGALRTANPLGHAWRGALGVASMSLNFAAIGLLPLADAIAIGYLMPLLATAFAAIFLGERVRLFRWSAIFIGLAGILIILWPRLDVLKGASGFSAETIGALCALGGATMVAVATIVIRTLVVAERTSTIVIYFSAACTIASLFTIPFGWQVPSAGIAALLILSGIVGGIGQILITESYRYAENSTIAPLEYTSMVFGVAIAYLLFDEVPTTQVLIGSAIVIAAGLLLIWREQQLALQRPPAVAVKDPGTER